MYANPDFQIRVAGSDNAEPVTVAPGQYPYWRLSPDAKRVALQQAGRGDIEVLSLEGGGSERITSEGAAVSQQALRTSCWRRRAPSTWIQRGRRFLISG